MTLLPQAPFFAKLFDSGGAVFNALHTSYKGNGTSAGRRLQTVLGALPASGGTVDARGFEGAQTLDVDIFATMTAQKPVLILFGSAVFTVSVAQNIPPQVSFDLAGTKFVLSDGVTQSFMFKFRTGSGLLSCTNGSPTVTLNANPTNGVVAQKSGTIGVFGHIPTGAVDRTTFTADPGAGGTTLDVVSTAAFPSTGFLVLEGNEIAQYTGTTATSFTGVTRGAKGTTASAHGIGTNVDRAVYETYRISAVSGLTLTLERNVTAPTATLLDFHLGVSDVSFKGVGVIDGAKPASDTSANGVGVYAYFANRLVVEDGIKFLHWDHSGVLITQGRDCSIGGFYKDIGWPSLNLGSAIWFFGGTQDCDADARFVDCNIDVAVDSRTTAAAFEDNRCNGNDVLIRRSRGGWRPAVLEEGDHNHIEIRSAIGHTSSALSVGSPQWGTPNGGIENTFVIGSVSPQNPIVSYDANMADKRNTIISTIRVGTHSLQEGGSFGNQLITPPTFFSLTYSASITPDAGRGEDQLITVTNTSAFTINNPINPQHGRRLTIYIFNNSGGAMGTVTFGSEFRLAGAFVNPANGSWRAITFIRQTSTKWREQSRSAADSAN